MFASALDEAQILIMRQDYGSAIPKLAEALNGDFYDTQALFMLGACFAAQGMSGASVHFTNAAIQSRAQRENKPFPDAMVNLGGAYKAEDNREMAAKCWLEALKFETNHNKRAKLFSNIASLHLHEGCPEKALEYAECAIAEDPDFPNGYANHGMACLEMGRWVEGWKGWKYTHVTGDRPKRTYAGIPDWDGTPGQTVIVVGDQGIGDEIFFASALADMQRACKRVILDCHPRLPALFARSFPEIEVHGTRKDLTELPWFKDCGADASVMLSDLFSYFRLKDEDWPGTPYLRPDGYSLAVARQSVASIAEPNGSDKSLRIGISWTGGTKATRQHLRSIPISQLEPILRARPDAQWFSLQYTEDAARQVCALEERTGIRIAHFPSWVESTGYDGPHSAFNYDKTASFVASLDLVISVPTTVHHLAGALGVPNWLLAQSRPDWRCQVKGKTLPWYNSTRVYRQEADGDWFGPLAWVAEDLKAFRP